MVVKALYLLMNQDLKSFMLVFMRDQKKVYGDRQGKRGKRENLVAGRRKGNNDLIAPMVFTVSLNAESFEGWLALYLLPCLTTILRTVLEQGQSASRAKKSLRF